MGALAAKLLPVIMRLITSPAVEEEAEELASETVNCLLGLIAEEIREPEPLLMKIQKIFRRLFNMETNTVVTAAEGAAETTLVQTAAAQLSTATAGTASSDLIVQVNNLIESIEADENSGSKSWYAREVRDPAEVIILKALIVAATAGSAAAIISLQKKLGK